MILTADLHHLLPGCFPAFGLQGTVACLEAVRGAKNCSQMRHLRTRGPTTTNTLPIWSVPAEPQAASFLLSVAMPL
jgi:hypothetical protein